MALDAISTPTIVNEVSFRGRTLWAINGYDTDVSAGIEIKATPGVGKSLYLLSVLITSDDADAHPYLEDEDNTVLFGRFFSTVEGVVVSHKFDRPLKLTANKALQINSAAAGNVSVYIEGATAE